MLRHPRLNVTLVAWLLLATLLVTLAPSQTMAAPQSKLFLPSILDNARTSDSSASGNSTGSESPVHIAWFYKPPTNGDLGTVSSSFDTFVLTKNDEDERDAMRAQGAEGPFLQYLRFDAIMDPGSCTAQPWRNQVADRPGDFCSIRTNHPDWFLRDSNGNPIVDVEGSEHFYIMDPGNNGWRMFWLERATESQESLGWDGVFLDNVEASLYKRGQEGQLPAAYPTDASYQAAVEGFLSYLYTSYFDQSNHPLQANIIALEETSVWFTYLEYLDGAMEEGWAVDWSNGYLSQSQWEEHMSRVERTEASGKKAILVSQGNRTNTAREEFAFASYLLVANGNSSFRYSDSSAYHDIWLYDNYETDLGAPLGPRYQQGSVWMRDFQNGTVTVDLSAHSASIQGQAVVMSTGN